MRDCLACLAVNFAVVDRSYRHVVPISRHALDISCETLASSVCRLNTDPNVCVVRVLLSSLRLLGR